METLAYVVRSYSNVSQICQHSLHTQPTADWRERKTGVGSERNIEKGEKTDTSEVHIYDNNRSE